MNSPTTEEDKVRSIKDWLGTGSINIFGMELSGKDTQANQLADLLGGTVLGGGDILRNSIIPPHVQRSLDNGEYIPTKDYVDIVLPYLSKPAFTNRPLILSAVGRWIGEEKSVLAATKAAGHDIKAVIYLDIKKCTAFDRLKTAQRGRSDDYEEHVARRIKEFEVKTLPVLKVYQSLGLLNTISGEVSPAEVTDAILETLYQKANGA